MFYCISGFLVMYTTQNKPKGSFLLKRLVRLLPLYWLMTIATYAAMKIMPAMGIGEASFSEFAKSMLFIPYARSGMKSIGDVVRPIVGPGWTMYYDVYFALMFAVCMQLSHKYRGIIAGSLCLPLALLTGRFSTETPFLYIVCQPWWLSFVAGIVAFYVIRLLRTANKTSSFRICMGIVSVIAICLIFAMPLNSRNNALYSFFALVGTVLACRKFEAGRFISCLGNISYSFYLVHYYVIIVLGKFFDWSVISFSTMIGILVVLGCSTIGALISNYLIEQKVSTYILNKFQLWGSKFSIIRK